MARIWEGKARKESSLAKVVVGGGGALGQGLLTLAVLTFWARSLLLEGCPVHCGVLGSTPDLYPLDAHCTRPRSCDHQKDITRVPPGGAGLSPLEDHWLE